MVAFQLAYGTKAPDRPSQPTEPPSTISMNPVWFSEYSHGLRNPSVGFPCWSRTAFNREIIAAKTGAAALKTD